MQAEQISMLFGIAVAVLTLLTPLLRLTSLLSRLNALLEQLGQRTTRCEERLDTLESREGCPGTGPASCRGRSGRYGNIYPDDGRQRS